MKYGINKETAVALMIACGGETPKTGHPDILEYIDNEYERPEGITPETGETFDSIVETWDSGGEDERTVTWGVGIIGKGTDSEIVNRMIYPDGTEISLINFNGEGGLG